MEMYDVVIVGGGPAGLTAAIYLARAKYRVLVVEKEKFGGQITITDEVVNYPGVQRVSGRELTENMRMQAESFGAEFMLSRVTAITEEKELSKIATDRGELYAFGVLIATGAHPRTIGFPGEEKFKGRGVAYCATCDGEFFAGREVFVVGGGYAAAEESVFLTRYASHVTVLVREDDFTCARATAQAARDNPKITVLTNTEVVRADGDERPRKLVYRNNKTGEQTEYSAGGGTFGIFVFAGYAPETDLVKDIVALDEQGYIVTDRTQRTSLPGIYAAGDVCAKNLRQVVTATGDGAVAATELERYVAKMQKKTGIVPQRSRLAEDEDSKGASGNDASDENTSDKATSDKVISDRDSSEKNISDGNISDKGTSENITSDKNLSGKKIQGKAVFDDSVIKQLCGVFDKMENPLVLEVHTDGGRLSKELILYMNELAGLTDKLTVRIADTDNDTSQKQRESPDTGVGRESPGKDDAWELPYVCILRGNGADTGLAFHGVPGGHEFTSFVLGLYNASGEGQGIAPEFSERIRAIDKTVNMKVLVSLSCTMCPDLVTAAQKIASLNEHVTAHVYDVAHFPQMRERYNVMSVPCLVTDTGVVSFGRKNIGEILEIIEK